MQRGERLGQRLLRGRLGEEVDGAEPEAALPVLVHRDDVDGNVAGGRIVLEVLQGRHAARHRQHRVDDDRIGPDLACQGCPRLAARREDDFEALGATGAQRAPSKPEV